MQPGKKEQKGQQPINIDEELDRIAETVEEWKVYSIEQYTLERLKKEIAELQKIQVVVYKAFDRLSEGIVGEKYTPEERTAKANEITQGIGNIDRLLKSYKNELEGKIQTGVLHIVPQEPEKWYKRLGRWFLEKIGLKEPEEPEIKTVVIPDEKPIERYRITVTEGETPKVKPEIRMTVCRGRRVEEGNVNGDTRRDGESK